jgi:hypothetical protein
VLVKVVRRQDGGQDRDLGLESGLNDALEHRLRAERMPVDTANPLTHTAAYLPVLASFLAMSEISRLPGAEKNSRQSS